MDEQAGNSEGGDVEAQVEAQAWVGEQAMEQAETVETFEVTQSAMVSLLLPISVSEF